LCGSYDRITRNDKATKDSDIPDADDAVARSYAIGTCSKPASLIDLTPLDVSPTNPCEELLNNAVEFAPCRNSRKVDFNSWISRCVDATRADKKRSAFSHCFVITAVMRLCAIADASLRINLSSNSPLLSCGRS
jgi:hypothetical protein